MGLIVDTGVFIQIERRKSQAALFDFLRERAMVVSAITVSELFVGVHRADSEARRAYRTGIVRSVLEALPVLPFTATTAEVHARVNADLMARGQMIGAHDLIIAATALEHGDDVLTTNRKEFERIAGLAVLDFPPAPLPSAG